MNRFRKGWQWWLAGYTALCCVLGFLFEGGLAGGLKYAITIPLVWWLMAKFEDVGWM